MTLEELNRTIEKANEYYKSEVKKLELEVEGTKKWAYETWAKDNARFQIGDIIKYPSTGTIIKIERIGYGLTYHTKKPYVTYWGPTLTKKLIPAKNGNPNFSMYDDGRDIVKL